MRCCGQEPAVNVAVTGKRSSCGFVPKSVSWLCVACLGLYQFMDFIYAPMLASAVRRSPFTDSKRISINISVSRSFTFTWLSAATRYYNTEGLPPGDIAALPPAGNVVPEELSSFKDFYVSDLRARVMAYLRVPHQNILSAGSIEELPGVNVYRNATAERIEAREAAKKKMKLEDRAVERTTCESHQPLEYSGENDGIVLDIACSHPQTETLLTRSGLPTEYSNNRGDCVLHYRVLYDYVCPFLHSIGWGPPYAIPESVTHIEATPRVPCLVGAQLSHANIFLLGNYRKMSRSLSQSPWFSGGERVGSFSLQEVIAAPVLPFFFPEGVQSVGATAKELGQIRKDSAFPANGITAQRTGAGLNPEKEGDLSSSSALQQHPSIIAAEQVYGYGLYKFHSAGREDVDVRMLGSGRPFVLEIVSPSRETVTESDLQVLSERINASETVEINALRLTGSDVTVRLARHSESKIKRYRCVVWSSRGISGTADEHVREINKMRDLTVYQKTPLRVLHRRSLHTRPRVVHLMHIQPINEHWLVLDIETQAGTYIKEFVHGDMGRTLPNLGTLLHSRADIVQLDVVGMTIEDVDKAVNDSEGKRD